MKWTKISLISFTEELSRKTAWEILKIKPPCTRDELRKAYMKLVKMYHPDQLDPFMKKQGEETLKIINEAYEKAKVEMGYDD